MLLSERFDSVKESKTTTKVVVKGIDGIHYSVNYRLRDLYSYQMACARSACSYGEDSKAVEYYKGMFDCYGGERNIEFIDVRSKALAESEIIDRIRSFGLDALCGELTTQEVRDISKAMGLKNKNGRTLGVNAMSKRIKRLGYSLSDRHKIGGIWYRTLSRDEE